MATEHLYLKGTAKWAKVFKPDEEYDNFTINVYMDEASRKLFAEAGLQLTPKEDEDGEFVTFRRPNYKQIKNELVHFGAPQVIDEQGVPVTTPIGNGSEVVVKVIVYDSKKGKGHRLDGVQVTKLVEYAGSGEGAPNVVTPEGVSAF